MKIEITNITECIDVGAGGWLLVFIVFIGEWVKWHKGVEYFNRMNV